MYKKLSKKAKYNINKSCYFFETSFSEKGLFFFNHIVKKKNFEIIEFLDNKNTKPIFESKKIYLSQTYTEIVSFLNSLNKEKRYAFVNIPVELLKHIKIKHFFIYSRCFPADKQLNELHIPYIILGRNFTEEKMSHQDIKDFKILKYDPIPFFDKVIAIFIVIFLTSLFIYTKTF